GNKYMDKDYLILTKDCLIERKDGIFIPKKGFELHPVIQVTWYGANAYCEWLSRITGKKYRLPSESEWEYAAAGGTGIRNKWAGTDEVDQLRQYGNFSRSEKEDTFDYTSPVKSFKANSLDLYDMSGNVWEWCMDTWAGKIDDVPSDGSSRDKGNLAKRAIRGGAWNSFDEIELEASFRSNGIATKGYYSVGFRPAGDP
ncbi:MAG: SUMF1/EgtB/PvdO family nonheme iron enzyme, partial [Bacteroidota bacterium]